MLGSSSELKLRYKKKIVEDAHLPVLSLQTTMGLPRFRSQTGVARFGLAAPENGHVPQQHFFHPCFSPLNWQLMVINLNYLHEIYLNSLDQDRSGHIPALPRDPLAVNSSPCLPSSRGTAAIAPYKQWRRVEAQLHLFN
jgi:hypothetical protein